MPAQLHYEPIEQSTPARRLLFTHGIYGSGSNWRSIARKLVERRPDWGVVLVDLRHHGSSEHPEPPNDLAACAQDLAALAAHLGNVGAIAGHSFGGKVVLATRALAPPGLAQTWILDASPSASPGAERDPGNTVARVLELMERMPRSFARRDDFVSSAIAEGQTPALSQWLAMNYTGDPPTLRLDLDAMREMLTDYYARDLWPIALDPALPGTVEVVIATRSHVLTNDDRRRLAAAPPHVHVHKIEAEHWLHIDAPDAVVDLLARSL